MDAVNLGEPDGDGAQRSATLPTADDVRNQVDAKDYRGALQSLLRVLDLKGSAAEPYDRAEMLLLRAECQMQIRQTKAALDSLDAALKECAAKGKADMGALVLAHTELLLNSPNMQYVSRTRSSASPPKPINILDRQVRPDAYQALLDDEWDAQEQRIKAALEAPTMPPILEAAKIVATLRGVEKGATGSTHRSDDWAASLSQHARAVLAGSLNDMGESVDKIIASANEMVVVPVPKYDAASGKSWLENVSQKRGLNSRDRQNLKVVTQTCAQIISAAGDLVFALDVDREEYQKLAANSGALQDKVAAAARVDYSKPDK